MVKDKEHKECSKCKRILEKNSKNFYNDKNRRDKFSFYCKNCSRMLRREAYTKNPLKQYYNNIKRLYGITYEGYLDLLQKQNYRCDICGFTLVEESSTRYGSDNVRRSHIDHCHKTKKIRGILCERCNRGLSLFKDNPFMLIKAVKYIKKNKK